MNEQRERLVRVWGAVPMPTDQSLGQNQLEAKGHERLRQKL